MFFLKKSYAISLLGISPIFLLQIIQFFIFLLKKNVFPTKKIFLKMS
jgi:hypothetical protein